MYIPPYAIKNPDHLKVFAEAHAKLPEKLYDFFTKMYDEYREYSPELVDNEVQAIKYIIAANGDIESAWSSYQNDSMCTDEDEGLNPVFELYQDELLKIDFYDPNSFMDNELVDGALERLPTWLYDMLMPRLYQVEQEYFRWQGAISYLVDAGGTMSAAQAAVKSVNPNAGEDPALPTGQILITLRKIQEMIKGTANVE